MIKAQLTGTVTDVFPAEHIGNFTKRVFWIMESGTNNPQNHYAVEVWGADVDQVRQIKIGQEITVFLEIRGKKWAKNGREGIINTLRCTGFKFPGNDIAQTTPF